MSGRSVVVILDPHHAYGQRIVERLWRHYGLRTVCVYTDPEARVRAMPAWPLLDEAIAEERACAPEDLEECARSIARRFEVVAVIPYLERHFVETVRVSRALGLEWTDLDRVALVRDKAALKAHLRARAPALGLRPSRKVSSVDEVRAGGTPERYVLKPNSGFGQQRVYFLDADSRRADIEAAFEGAQGALVLEQFADGVEYGVQGQVDHAGRAQVWSVLRYVKDHDKPIRDATELVRPDEPVFARVRDYALAVVDALGVERVPFHLECKVDEFQTHLIEVALRPIGMLGSVRFDFLHKPRFSTLDWACHHWVSEAPWGDPGLDWERYGSFALRDLLMHSDRRGRVFRVEGAEALEAEPYFWRWLKKPELGSPVRETRSLFDLLWSATFVDPRGSMSELKALERRARALIEVHTRGDLQERASVFTQRALRRAGVEARRARYRMGSPE